MDITSNEVLDDVRAQLADDRRLPYADEIAVQAHGAGVTLRGTVGLSRRATPRRCRGRRRTPATR